MMPKRSSSKGTPQTKWPADFLWGASTASHQVEGGAHNQWSVWELAQASELASTAEKRLDWLPNWSDVKVRATDPDNYVSGGGVDHYRRYEEDFDFAKKMQLNAFRFGIEWSRLQPKEGAWDEAAIRHYHDYIDALLERGIEPVLTIWHWTMPVWFTDKGGFENKENLALFDAFVTKVAEEYADKVVYVVTLNEPNVYASFSYLSGEWPPQQKSWKTFIRVYRNLMKAHRRAYDILKARNSTLQVGVSSQLGNIQAKRPHNLLDVSSTKALRWFWNWWFLNSAKRHQDFVGINYYFTDYWKALSFSVTDRDRPKQGNDIQVPLLRRINPTAPLNDLGWYMEPEGLYPLLVRAWAHYKKPILVTENGVADGHDQYRQWWIEQTVVAMERAMSEGVELKGYMHWSLLDNFEWSFGWWPKFGLLEVDRENGMKRKPRPSAVWFARFLRDLRNGEAAPVPRGASALASRPAVRDVATSAPSAERKDSKESGKPETNTDAQDRQELAKGARKRPNGVPAGHHTESEKPRQRNVHPLMEADPEPKPTKPALAARRQPAASGLASQSQHNKRTAEAPAQSANETASALRRIRPRRSL